MKDNILEEIKEFAFHKLSQNYGFCSYSHNSTKTTMATDNRQGNEIIITFELKPIEQGGDAIHK